MVCRHNKYVDEEWKNWSTEVALFLLVGPLKYAAHILIAKLQYIRVCAVEDRVCVGVELLSEDGAVVHVTCVGKALRCIFKQQITFSILMRLKEPELCVWVDGQSFLWLHKEVVHSCCEHGPCHDGVWWDDSQITSLPVWQWGPAAVSTQQLKVWRWPPLCPASGVQTEDVCVKAVLLEKGHVTVAFPAAISN